MESHSILVSNQSELDCKTNQECAIFISESYCRSYDTVLLSEFVAVTQYFAH